MAWGDSGAWGTGPWGVGVFAVAAARAVSENVVRVLFSEVPVATGLLTRDDALRPQNFSFQALGDSRSVRPVDVAVVAESDLAVDVGLDRALSPSPNLYVVYVSNVRSALGLPLDPAQSSAEFPGLLLKRVPPDPETLRSPRDFASPQQRVDTLDPLPSVTIATLGAIPVDDTGDYAYDEGAANLRKRIFRRLVTRRGGFYHLPDYGLGVPDMLKRGISQSRIRRLQADASAQIGSEPDLVGATITATLTKGEGGALLRIHTVGTYRGRRFSYSPAFRLAA